MKTWGIICIVLGVANFIAFIIEVHSEASNPGGYQLPSYAVKSALDMTCMFIGGGILLLHFGIKKEKERKQFDEWNQDQHKDENTKSSEN
jgi:hypothetical protein